MRCRYVRVGAGPARTAPPPRRRYRPGTRALKEIRRYQKYVLGSAPCSCSHTHTNTHAICLPLNGVSGGQVDGAIDPAAAVRSFGVLACPSPFRTLLSRLPRSPVASVLLDQLCPHVPGGLRGGGLQFCPPFSVAAWYSPYMTSGRSADLFIRRRRSAMSTVVSRIGGRLKHLWPYRRRLRWAGLVVPAHDPSASSPTLAQPIAHLALLL
jgi:hypothetical protein